MIAAHLSTPYSLVLDYFDHVEKESYLILDNPSPTQTLKRFVPSRAEQDQKSPTFFQNIYYYLVGIHKDIDFNISDAEHKAVTNHLNLLEQLEETSLEPTLREQIAQHIDQVALKQVEAYEHIKKMNARHCISKLGLTFLSSALMISFFAKLYYDIAFCKSPDNVFGDQSARIPCPSITDHNYLTRMLMWTTLPLVGLKKMVEFTREKNFLGLFMEASQDDSSECIKNIALNSLMQANLAKSLILRTL